MITIPKALRWGTQLLRCRILDPYHRCLTSLTPVVTKLAVSTPKSTKADAPQYIKTDHEYKIARKYTIQALESIFGINTFTAFGIATKYKVLCKVNAALIKTNYAVYLKNNITKETLLKYPELLAETMAAEKIAEIQKLPYDPNVVAILTVVPLKRLHTFIRNELQFGEGGGRIATFSRVLQIPEQEACEFLARKAFLRSMPLDKIDSSAKTLTKFGISPEDICSDLWVLRYSNEQIEGRLSEAKEHKIDIPKTWMVRAQPEIFHNYIRRRSDNKLILGNSSLAEYLSERLECSVEVANYIIVKQPVLKNKSLKKIKDIIDFLFSAGFQPQHIIRVPKILVHSVETTKLRLKQLEDKGLQIDSLHMLTKSNKQFNQNYEALLKSKNKARA